MTTGVACPQPILQFFLPNGQLNIGGYVAPTVGGLPTAVYQDSGLITPLPLLAIPNQVTTGFPLNSYGQPSNAAGASQQVFLTPNVVYVFTVYDINGNQINQASYVNGVQVPTTQAGLGQVIWPQSQAELNAGVTPSNYGYPYLNPWRYGADGTGGANDTAAYAAILSVTAQMATTKDWQNGLAVPGYALTSNESNAKVISKVNNYNYPSDGQQTLNVFRFFTASQIADVLAGTALVDVSAAIQAANDYLEGKAVGAIATLTGLVAGTGYNGGNPGTFNNVAFTGGHGQFMYATVVVGTSGVISSITLGYSPPNSGTWLGNPGNGYQVGDVLSLTSANMVAAGAASGGSGCTINVAALATGGKQVSEGGTLFFPSGKYYCGTTGLRVGDMVSWKGTGILGTRFSWSNSYNGNGITIGPDASGFNGRGGVYAMGATLQQCSLEMSNGTGWGVYTIGLQQNGGIKNVWVKLGTGSTGGVFLQDHVGSANMLCEDVYVLPGGSSVSASAVGFHCDGGANLELNRCSCNGTTGSALQAGIAIASAGASVKIKNFQCELSTTHIDISAGAGEGSVDIDVATLNQGGSPAGLQGIWIHSGFAGTVTATQIGVGPGQVAIRNDNTNEILASQAGGGITGFYLWSGTSSDVSTAQNLISVPPAQQLTVASVGQTVTPIVNLFQSYIYSVSTTGGITVGTPTMGSNPMPTTNHIGHRIKITIKALATLSTTTWSTAYHLAGSWTNPASGNKRSIEFEWDGNVWSELWRTAADVPN